MYRIQHVSSYTVYDHMWRGGQHSSRLSHLDCHAPPELYDPVCVCGERGGGERGVGGGRGRLDDLTE